MFAIALLLALVQEPPVPTFGTTVVINSGLKGLVYHVTPGARHLPKFDKLKPQGAVYTTSLNITPRDFREGFPGVTDRYEWFAIDYTGRFWIENAGSYGFSLMADDGARLWVDGPSGCRQRRNSPGADQVWQPRPAPGAFTISGFRICKVRANGLRWCCRSHCQARVSGC